MSELHGAGPDPSKAGQGGERPGADPTDLALLGTAVHVGDTLDKEKEEGKRRQRQDGGLCSALYGKTRRCLDSQERLLKWEKKKKGRPARFCNINTASTTARPQQEPRRRLTKEFWIEAIFALTSLRQLRIAPDRASCTSVSCLQSQAGHGDGDMRAVGHAAPPGESAATPVRI